MNPLLQKRIETLSRQIDAIETRITAMAERETTLLAEKEEIRTEQWRNKKELTTLNRIAEDYDEIAARAEAYEKERAVLRASLTEILTRTRALRTEYES